MRVGTCSRVLVVSGIALALWYLYLFNYTAICHSKCPDASIRVLLLADPQMEGDYRAWKEGFYGEFNNWFNDQYYRFVFKSLINRMKPTHVVVLGDLFSSQHLRQSEHAKRLERYRRIFNHDGHELLLVNVSGNHDIGYAYEVTPGQLKRFEEGFGPANAAYKAGDHTLLNLNSMVLDSAVSRELHDQSWEMLRKYKRTDEPVILVTHLPLHKEPGKCYDGPTMVLDKEGNVRQQNFLSPDASRTIIEKVRPTVVINGHDHEGCYNVHYLAVPELPEDFDPDVDEREFQGDMPVGMQHHDPINLGPAHKYGSAELRAIPEYTLRALQGDYGGYAALLEVEPKEGAAERKPVKRRQPPPEHISRKKPVDEAPDPHDDGHGHMKPIPGQDEDYEEYFDGDLSHLAGVSQLTKEVFETPYHRYHHTACPFVPTKPLMAGFVATIIWVAAAVALALCPCLRVDPLKKTK